MAEDGNKQWIFTQYEEDDYTAIMHIATQKKIHYTKLLEEFAQEGISRYAQENGDGVDVDVFIRNIVLEARKRKNRKSAIELIAYEFQENPSEELGDQLKKMCERAGEDIEDVMSNINKSPQVVDLVKEIGMLTEAESWLVSFMQVGKMYDNKDIIREAEKRGFAESTIKRAKTRIGVRSKKLGLQRMWVFEGSLSEHSNGNGKQTEEQPF